MQSHVENKDRIVISVVTYSELKFGSIRKKASPKMPLLVDQFLDQIDSIMPWDTAAVDATTKIKSSLSAKGTPIGNNDAAIAGNAVALNCVLVTNNTREFQRVENLKLEDWSV
jgi:tRNA(fMet)-specific endonuclease VapC